jgi:large subunit ribosomal protein L30
MKKFKITQRRSIIGRPERQRRTMIALGLRRMHQSIEVEGTPQIMGMIGKVKHLITVEEL